MGFFARAMFGRRRVLDEEAGEPSQETTMTRTTRTTPTTATTAIPTVTPAPISPSWRSPSLSPHPSPSSSSPSPPTAPALPAAPRSPTVHFKDDTLGRIVSASTASGAPPPYPFEKDGCTTTTVVADEDTQNSQGRQPTILVLFKEDYDWARVYLRDLDYRVALRRALRRHLYKWYALVIIAITLAVLVSAKHTTIVDFCRPVTHRIRTWPGGWLIPIALLIVVSFPPLVGHEIIGILCGLVWGLGEGFGILAAGTFLGELATWAVFKWACTSRAKKYEQRNKLYASLTQLIREKSFAFVLILRFSAIPGHIVTAVSASAGAHFGSYCAAAFLTLPKQLVLVYLGTAFGSHDKKHVAISWCATAATFAGTVVAALYIYYQMRVVLRRSRLPGPAGAWADVEVAGEGTGAGVRVDLGRRSVDVILGPYAAEHGCLVRTRSLPAMAREMRRATGKCQCEEVGQGEKEGGREKEKWDGSDSDTDMDTDADADTPPPSLRSLGTYPVIVAIPQLDARRAPVLPPPYASARVRADSLRGTVSLDIARG